jgi:hypothetical protein
MEIKYMTKKQFNLIVRALGAYYADTPSTEPCSEKEILDTGFNFINAYNNLEKELKATGIGNDTAILMYYAPATFQNALNYYKKLDSGTAITKTIHRIAPVMSHIYSQIRALAECDEGVVIAFIADIAKSAMEPENMKISCEIQHVGNDFIVTRVG